MNENFQYDRINDGIKIFKYIGTAENVKIPATIKNLPVTEIGNKAFCGCNRIKSVDIPDSVKIIAEDAFDGCENFTLNISFSADVKFGNFFIKPKFIPTVKPTDAKYFDYTITEKGVRINGYHGADNSVIIPTLIENLFVTEIGYRAFYECRNLKEIIIPDSVTEIGEYAFYSCNGLRTIQIPNSIKRLNAQCFSWCENLSEVDILEGVTEIGYAAFSDCPNLKKIDIPDSVKYIDYGNFFHCTSLKLISLPANVETKEICYNCPAKIIYRDKK